MYLGNLAAKRDWGFAGDYVQAMWMMLQRNTPDDYVIATGNTWSVQQFLDAACAHVGIVGERAVKIDLRYMRPTEVDCLQGDASKARRVLGWTPTMEFGELVRRMCDSDLELAEQEAILARSGHENAILRG